jgi:GDP-4-dehydro-6-deoxy-D-mannose reductase
VRDVASAYRLLAEAGATGIVNICSGESRSARDLVAALGAVAPVEIDHVVDPALVRAHEGMDVRGDAGRLRELTGWAPAFPIERTLADSVAWWRQEIRAGRTDGRLHE